MIRFYHGLRDRAVARSTPPFAVAVNGHMVRIVQSVVLGTLITGISLAIGIGSGSERIWCVVMWHTCLLTALFKPGRESPAILLFVLAGVPIYSFTIYCVLGRFRSRRTGDGEQIVGREPR
jgi:hypothetical protein